MSEARVGWGWGINGRIISEAQEWWTEDSPAREDLEDKGI